MSEPELEPLPAPPQSTESSHYGELPSRGIMFNVVVPLVLLGLAGGIVMLLGTVQPEKRPPTDDTRFGRLKALPPVRVEQLRSLESTGKQLQLAVDGTVVPFQEARVAAEVAGRVVFKAADCEAGSFVEKDQVLMKIDPTDYELEVQRLGRLQEQEYEALSEVDQEMTNTKRLIDVAEQDVALQQREVDRLKAMREGFASPAEIDQASRALLASNQQLITLENQIALLRKRRSKLEASERLAATQLKAAEINLTRTEIRAPIEGVIVTEEADLNTFVSRGSVLVTIEDTSKVEVATNLRMDQLFWVLDQRGEKVDPTARGYDLPNTPAIIEFEVSGRDDLVYRWEGRLLSYDGIGLDPVTRTVPVRVVVDDPTYYVDDRGDEKEFKGGTPLVRGMFVRVKLLIEPQSQLIVIPARALQPGNRVIQFVPDESVLESSSGSGEDAAPGVDSPGDNAEESPSTTATLNEDLAGAFDPELWQPGRVYLRSSVNPVDSLVLDEENNSQKTVDSDFAQVNRMWVCQVSDPSLKGGSYVVVSPMASVEVAAMPVRAERVGMNSAPQSADSSRSTAARDLLSTEEI